MRSLLVVVLVAACGRAAPAPPLADPANCRPLPDASPGASAASNNTGLAADRLPSPQSSASLSLSAPQLGEQIPIERATSFEVAWLWQSVGEPSVNLEIALDAGRPRQILATRTSLPLSDLLPAGASLAAGSHWLFAAPVLATGFVPRPTPGAPRAAVARHFFVGPATSGDSGPSGAVWLRKPAGTYNGSKEADALVFDVFVFSATGAPLEPLSTVTLHGAGHVGELRLPSPFALRDVPSGDYDVAVSAPGAANVSSRFTVNRELGVTP